MGRRRTAGLTAALLVLLPLAACADEDAAELGSTEVDLARAERVWADVWAAPEELAVPTFAYGSNGQVVRFAGKRETAYTGGPLATARLETRVALEHGWEQYAALCADDTVTVQLVRGEDLDDAAIATVVATRGDSPRWSSVEVSVQVPHHADGSWPVTDERQDLAGSCIGAAGGPGELLDLPREPLDGDDAEEGDPDFDGWQRDELSDGEEKLRKEVGADPWVRGAGVTLSRPSLRDGDSRRFGSYASGTLPAGDPDPRAAVAAVVADMQAWEPTWALCAPTEAGSVDVRLRLVTEHGVATARVRMDPSVPDEVQWSIALPVPEGPVPARLREVPTVVGGACLGDDPLPPRLTLEGAPVAVPVRLQPVP